MSSTVLEADALDHDTLDPTPTASELPGWFVVGLVVVIAWCSAAGATGTALLVFGIYRAAVVAVVATAASVGAGFLAGRGLVPRRHPDHSSAAIALVVALAFFALAGAFHSEHLLLDRDPAAYLTTGRSIARTHELRPKTQSGPFAQGSFGTPNSVYDPVFFPMLPVLLAQAWSAGGDSALLLLGPFLGALGLLAVYALAARVLGPRRGLLALALFVLEPLQLWFARDAYSELVVQVVALGGLWLYLEGRERRSWKIGLVSGALVASAALARVDVLAILCGVVVFGALDWVRADADKVPVAARRTVSAFLAAVVLGTGVAMVATSQAADEYLGHVDHQYTELLMAFGACLVGTLACVLVHRARPGIGRAIATRRGVFVAGVLLAVAVSVWAYVIRPLPRSALPVLPPGAPPGALRNAFIAWHYSYSLHWFAAYFGVVAIGAAFLGFVLLSHRAIRGDRAAAAVVLVAVPVAVMYLARPSITPDQPWAMRRFLPVVIPAIAIALAVVIDRVWRTATAGRSLRRRVPAVGAAALLVLLIAAPSAAAARPFVHARMQHGAQAAVHGICRDSGDDAAVLVLNGRGLDVELTPVLHAFCGVPSAHAGAIDLPKLARAWKQDGRRLVVVSASPVAVLKEVPGATLIGHHVVSDDDEPQRLFDRAPGRFRPVPAEIWVFSIPPAAP